MATPNNLLAESYDGGYINSNGGFRTAKPVYIDNDLTITGTTTIQGITLTNLTVTGNTVIGDALTDTLTVTGATTIRSTSATAFTVGAAAAGATPAFSVDASTSSQVTGLKVVGAASGGTVAVVVTQASGNANLTINALGSGTIGIGSVSTGAVTITPATTITGLATLTAGFTSAANAILKSGTAVPATAGAVAAGAPITLYSGAITIEATSDTPTHTRPKGSICINTGGSSGSTRMYVNTDGAGTWTSFTTAA